MVMFFCMTLISLAAEQSESGEQKRSFALPQHGKLIFSVPTTWKHSVRQPPGDLPPTITFFPDKGDEFNVLITPLWSPRNDAEYNLYSMNLKTEVHTVSHCNC